MDKPKCKACHEQDATTWWGWSQNGKLLKAAFCPQCRKSITVKMTSLGSVNPVGRPRTKPPGLKRREWWASDAEIDQLRKLAAIRDCSVQELVRQLAIAACRNVA